MIASLHSELLQRWLLFAIGHQQTKTLHGGPWVTFFFNSFLHVLWWVDTRPDENMLENKRHPQDRTCPLYTSLWYGMHAMECKYKYKYKYNYKYEYSVSTTTYMGWNTNQPAITLGSYTRCKSHSFNKLVLTHVIHHPHVYNNCTDVIIIIHKAMSIWLF